jgi:hypothetical protein
MIFMPHVSPPGFKIREKKLQSSPQNMHFPPQLEDFISNAQPNQTTYSNSKACVIQ